MGGEACISHPERVSNNWVAPRPRPLKKKCLSFIEQVLPRMKMELLAVFMLFTGAVVSSVS